MTRAAADLSISAINVPASEPAGDRVTVSVEVFNNNLEAAPNETHDQGWVIVESPALADDIIWHCFLIEPQGTFIADDCSSAVTNCSGGSFTMPSTDTVLNVDAGGFAEGESCADVRLLGVQTDQASTTVIEFDPSLVTIVNGSGTISPVSVATDEIVTFGFDVDNGNDDAALFDVSITDQETGTTWASQTGASVAASTTGTFSYDVVPGEVGIAPGEYTIDAQIGQAQTQTLGRVAVPP